MNSILCNIKKKSETEGLPMKQNTTTCLSDNENTTTTEPKNFDQSCTFLEKGEGGGGCVGHILTQQYVNMYASA